MKYIIILILFFFIPFSHIYSSQAIFGIANVIDGDTIKINAKKIRLEGIDAPEAKQKCTKKTLSILKKKIEKKYFCGTRSTQELKKLIEKKLVKCSISGKDKYKRYLGTCYQEKININKIMVRKGYAVAYKRYSKRYINDENYAKENKLGLWEGTFLRPEKWRKLK
tara:strand:- start:609 stop:1106 length:498 start_codon:yes stop_codon:yes gene_type:complete